VAVGVFWGVALFPLVSSCKHSDRSFCTYV